MLQKSTMLRVLECFMQEPNREFTLKDISQIIKLAHTSVKTNLEKLTKMKLINEKLEKKGKRTYPLYKANKLNSDFTKYKKINNLTKILESGLKEYLKEKLMPKTIILFGSFDRGEDEENSDIDLYIEAKEEKLDLKKFEKILKRKIQLQFNQNINNYPNELKNNIINGTKIHGYLEVF
jgi:predicted nucleotidyltransferase